MPHGLFRRYRYVKIVGLLSAGDAAKLYEYALAIADSGAVMRGDDMLADTPAAYGDPVMNALLLGLLPDVERLSGLSLFPTYSYFRVYKRADRLERHRDRHACEISLSLALGTTESSPWPLSVEGPHGTYNAALSPGDALLYHGIECTHWRDPFAGERAAQLFLHYVNRRGPYAGERFDGRTSIDLGKNA